MDELLSTYLTNLSIDKKADLSVLSAPLIVSLEIQAMIKSEENDGILLKMFDENSETFVDRLFFVFTRMKDEVYPHQRSEIKKLATVLDTYKKNIKMTSGISRVTLFKQLVDRIYNFISGQPFINLKLGYLKETIDQFINRIDKTASNNTIPSNTLFLASSIKKPKDFNYDHVGFLTSDGKQIQMSGHRLQDGVYITNKLTDDEMFNNDLYQTYPLSTTVQVPVDDTLNSENCTTFVDNVLKMNKIDMYSNCLLKSVSKNANLPSTSINPNAPTSPGFLYPSEMPTTKTPEQYTRSANPDYALAPGNRPVEYQFEKNRTSTSNVSLLDVLESLEIDTTASMSMSKMWINPEGMQIPFTSENHETWALTNLSEHENDLFRKGWIRALNANRVLYVQLSKENLLSDVLLNFLLSQDFEKVILEFLEFPGKKAEFTKEELIEDTFDDLIRVSKLVKFIEKIAYWDPMLSVTMEPSTNPIGESGTKFDYPKGVFSVRPKNMNLSDLLDSLDNEEKIYENK